MKIKAFTIIELTVVMLLSSIVISMAYFAFDILTKRYLHYKKESEIRYEMTNIQSLLSHAFFVSDSVKVSTNTLHVYTRFANIDYELLPDYIIKRDRNTIDTFHFPVVKAAYLFDNKQVDEGIIDQLHIEMEFNGKNIPAIFSKKYSADYGMSH